MNVSFLSIVGQALASESAQSTQMNQLDQEASTGNSLLQPSDNPAAYVAVMESQADTSNLTTNLANIQSATTLLNSSTSALQTASSVVAL